MPTLIGPVGKGQHNHLADARLVQQLLNRYRSPPSRLLRVDGAVGHERSQRSKTSSGALSI